MTIRDLISRNINSAVSAKKEAEGALKSLYYIKLRRGLQSPNDLDTLYNRILRTYSGGDTNIYNADGTIQTGNSNLDLKLAQALLRSNEQSLESSVQSDTPKYF